MILCTKTHAQSRTEVDSLVKAKVSSYINKDVSIQGKLNISTELNANASQKKTFFNYRVSSNVQANFYGFSIPLSFTFSNGKTTYGYGLNPIQLPSFNRIGLSPKYKDYTLHIGYRQLDYMKYTLSGYQFRGIGAEYSPKGYYVSSMRGSLTPAVAEDLTNISLIEPTFNRNIWGLKTGIEKENYSIGVSFINVEDDPLSLENYKSFTSNITPRENAVFGAYGKYTFLKNLSLEGEYAFSGLSNNIVDDPYLDIKTQYTAFNFFGLFTTRHKSVYDKAYNTSLSYKLGDYTLAYNKERVDPNFRTLGSVFFNRNFITNTGSLSGQILSDKLNFDVEIGEERIAEPDSTQENVGRLIGSTSLKYAVNESLSLNGKYSNLNNSAYVRKPSIQSSIIDSILQTQTKEKISIGSNYRFGEKKNQGISTFASYQRGIIVDKDLTVTNKTNTIKSIGLTYSIATDKNNHSLSYAISDVQSDVNKISTHNISHNYSRSLKEEQNLSATNTLSLMKAPTSTNFSLQSEIGYDFTYKKLHKMKTSIGTQVGRSVSSDRRSGILAFIIRLNYDVAFRKSFKKLNSLDSIRFDVKSLTL